MIKKLFPLLLSGVLWGLLAGSPTHARAGANDPPPAAATDPATEKIETLATALIAASNDAARDRLLNDAPPELSRDERLRRRFHYLTGELIYAGEYDRGRALHAFSRQWCMRYDDEIGLMLEEWGEGNIEGFRGNNRAALEKFETATRFFAARGDTKREASLSTCMSIVYLQLGDFRRALAGVQRALTIHQATGDHELITNDLHVIGNIHLDQGQPERAITYYERGLAEAGDNDEWQMYFADSLGQCHAMRGDLPAATAAAEKALALARKRQDPAREAGALTNLGNYLVESGRLEEAEKLYRTALGEAEALQDTHRLTVALTGLADVIARRAERPEPTREVLAMAERALALARQSGDPAAVWKAGALAGKLLRRAGRKPEARAALEESIAAIEDTRGRLTGGDMEATAFFEDKLAPYHETVALLIEENRPMEALAFAERAKARVLLEVLRGSRNGFEETLSAPERETLQKRAADVAALNRELAAAPAGERAKTEQRLGKARLAREAAENDALAAHPELRRQVPPRENDASGLNPAVLDTLLGQADARGALVEFVVGQEETFAFVVRRTEGGKASPQVQFFRLPLGNTTLGKRVEHYRRTLADRGPGWVREARALGDDVLGALRPALVGADRLVIVPDGPLWELPFQTLPDAAGKDAARAEETLSARRIALSPSLGFLLQARNGHRDKILASGDTRLLAFGDPAVRQPSTGSAAPMLAANDLALRDDELVALPDAGREVQALQTLYGPDRSRVFIGRDARESTFRREAARDYDVIHFATHGVCNDRAPLYSHLLLSQADLDPEEDGLLEAWELMRLPVRARLAVLSACETARGRVGAGEGMIGLSWALFTAGCPSCVVSQWKVDSASNTDLMVEFHRQLRAGTGRAEALRRASGSLAAKADYRHPFYWAPFVLIGDGD